MTDRASFSDRPEPREKLGPLALTLILHALFLALFLFHKSAPIPRQVEQTLSTFFLPDSQEKQSEAAKAQTKQERKTRDEESPTRPTPPKPIVTPPKPPEIPVPVQPNYLTMSSAEFAASNIANMPSYRKSQAQGAGADSKTAAGPGEGPGGVQLYEADWFRRPTEAELGGYLPASAPREGWGLIACRTVARYHVEDCQTLGESPPGSGFGRAVREAAWQFLVMPPRINGKPQVGAWVRIRIDYHEREGPAPGG